MSQPGFHVGIDVGTTYSAAAVLHAGETRPETFPLGEQFTAVPSMVFLAPDGSLLCGDAAQRRAVTEPRRVIREFKRRIGDNTPLVVGGTPVFAEAVASRFVAWILDRVVEREGRPAGRVALTHPAEWGPHKRESVIAALAERGVTDVVLLTEPEAAAVGYASTERVGVGGTVAVYDLGGGTFDAAVVRKLPDGRFEVIGKPVGIERLGGVDFDEAVLQHVRSAIGEAWLRLDPTDAAVQSAVAGLRRECTAAKEALSVDTEVQIPVMLPGLHTQVRLGRAEFEDQIRPAVADTVEALRRALSAAGTRAADLDAVLMVGGSSRIPLITQLVSAELGRPVSVDADPKSVIAIGAAIAAAGAVRARPAAAPMVARRPVPAAEEPTVTLVAPIPPRPIPAAIELPRRATPVARSGARLRGRTLTMIVGAGLAASLASGIAVLAFAETDADAAPQRPPAADLLAANEVAGTVAPDPVPATPDQVGVDLAPTEAAVVRPRQPAVVAAVRPRVPTGASRAGSGATADPTTTPAPGTPRDRSPDPAPDTDDPEENRDPPTGGDAGDGNADGTVDQDDGNDDADNPADDDADAPTGEDPARGGDGSGTGADPGGGNGDGGAPSGGDTGTGADPIDPAAGGTVTQVGPPAGSTTAVGAG